MATAVGTAGYKAKAREAYMPNDGKFSAIPANACRMGGGEVILGDNGETAKTSPVRLKARSGQAIEHWFWGKVIHDFAGMRRNKPRLTIDYAHNDQEVLGYLNHFETNSGDLVASGALTPFREDDRASEVLFKMKQGVPYEASIFFGGDGIKIEEVEEGASVSVNGAEFAGPGIVIREWPLRGVAICPYGADANTQSEAMGAGETFTATKISKEEVPMNEVKQAVEAKTVAEVKAVDAPVVEAEALKTPVEVGVKDFTACGNFNVVSQLAKIKVPALIICGAEDRLLEQSKKCT